MTQRRQQVRHGLTTNSPTRQDVDLSKLLSYPISGHDSSFRYVLAVILFFVSFTLVPTFFYLGFLWRSAYWKSRKHDTPPAVSDWPENITAGIKALVTIFLVFILPFSAINAALWTFTPMPVDELAIFRTGFRYAAYAATASLFVGTSLFINCAQANSLKPIVTTAPYRDLVSTEYLVAWAVTIGVTLLFAIPYAVLTFLSMAFLFPLALLICLAFYHAIFTTALFSTALAGDRR